MPVSLARVRSGARVRVASMSSDPPAWTFDVPAIERACERLGITHEVVLACAHYGSGRYGGMHKRQARAGGAKVSAINVANGTPAERASRVLWHELTHAAQYARGSNMGGTRRLMREDYAAYLEHPHEEEARGNEHLAHKHPLVTF